MQLLPLQDVASQIQLGLPLPWGIRDGNGKLLLARGHRVVDAEMLSTLLSRGMFVDAAEMRAARGAGVETHKPKANFLGSWRLASARLNTLLTTSPVDLRGALGEVADNLMALADRYPDRVLFQVLRHDQTKLQSYGVSHSLHCAAVCCLTGKRMGWNDVQRRSLVSAAMSMNVAMIELQGRLAVQSAPPTPEQRQEINNHPFRSAQLLMAAGVVDPTWLAAVEQHHELTDGTGYPSRRTDVAEMAQALHYVDVFTAKMSVRSSRVALMPDVAVRDIFASSAGHPLAAALVKEFGIYPPGCFVRLASGEVAIVVQRGQSVTTPVVASLTKVAGQPVTAAPFREIAEKGNAIVALVADADVMVRVPWESLYPDD